MFFAMCPDGGIFVFALLALLLLVVTVGACLAAAVLATISLAKWAAARHKRLAVDAR